MILRKCLEINFKDSFNKHYGTRLEKFKKCFIVVKKRNKVNLN